MVVLSELSEGSSSSSSIHGYSSPARDSNSSTDGYKYDVFLSFRGLDTRFSFTNHLHKALKDANITVFLDDEEIEAGKVLKPEMEDAIKASRAFIIVLSKNYASSTWCLDELVLILEQHKTPNRVVIPIFYHVEPTHVRKQQSSFGDAMEKHKQTMDEEIDEFKKLEWAQKIDRWNKALTEVANLKGKYVNGRLEAKFIAEVVNDIYRRTNVPSRIAQPLLIGMESSIKFITSWLKYGSTHTADILTICGIGGIGKTSLARYVYTLHSHKFHASSYIPDISRRCDGKFNGLLDIQKQLCADISKPNSVQVYEVPVYTSMIENLVAHKRVFLVLDDIDSCGQIDALLGSKDFHLGSKVIITTKDTSLIERSALFKLNTNPKHSKHMLEGLHEIHSQQLFCFHAFNCNNPKAGYEEVSHWFVKYCEGHPLALEVLGKLLHNRDVAYWEGCIKVLKKETDSRINNILRISFDYLPSNNVKELFKDITCFFVGTNRDVTETILEACGIDTRSGIPNLIDRCLLSIGWKNEFKMHGLVQEMGRCIVRQESLDKPWKRSRLCCHEESFKVLKQKNIRSHGKGSLKGLALDMQMLKKEKSLTSYKLKTDALSRMDNLMLLQLNYVQMDGSYENFPEEIRWLCMHGFHLKSIPSELPMQNLIALDMSYSKIESLYICFGNPQRPQKRQKLLLGLLKILNLSYCEQLRCLDGFEQFPALERLIVRNCIGLVEICESIEECPELVLIDLSYCKKFEKLPRNISMLKKVETLLLDGCDLSESRTEIRDKGSQEIMKANSNIIEASSSVIVEAIPSNLKFSMISLLGSLVELSLINNNLSNESFPMDLSCLSMLKYLCLDKNPIDSMPSFVRNLPRLEGLSMQKCKSLKSVEHPPHTLRVLDIYSFDDDANYIEKVVFDPEMSPLELDLVCRVRERGPYEIQGMIKMEAMEGVEEKVLRSLCWDNLDFLEKSHMGTSFSESGIQMFYEFGIFSTMYKAEEMPSWFRHRSVGPSISFTIPSSSSPNNLLTGLNFCSLHTCRRPDEGCQFSYDGHFPGTPMMTVSNITKNRTWIYQRYSDRSNEVEKCYILLSHWMFGMNEMEAGDHVTVTVTLPRNQVAKECGVSVVYDEGKKDEEEEDALVYYKSWNHIIGGDLSHFQTTTGQYILHNDRFFGDGIELYPYHRRFVPDGPDIQEEEEWSPWFRAISQRNRRIIGSSHEG